MDALTTLDDIYVHCPCEEGWEKLLAYLRKTGPDDAPLRLSAILASNGLDDALWCLRAAPSVSDIHVRRYMVWCVRQVSHLLTQPFIDVIDISERYTKGEADAVEMMHARMLVQLQSSRRRFVPGAMKAELAAEATASNCSMWTVTSATYNVACALASSASHASHATGDAITCYDVTDAYDAAFAVARAAQINKFREMFCTDDPSSIDAPK